LEDDLIVNWMALAAPAVPRAFYFAGQVENLFTNCRANLSAPCPARPVNQRPLIGRCAPAPFQIRIGLSSPPRRIPLTEWPFLLRNIEARIGYREHFAQHRELTGTRAPGLGCT
jgi:hypothetical protein